MHLKQGKLTLEDLRNLALKNGEPKQISGKRNLYEAIINMLHLITNTLTGYLHPVRVL